MDSDWKVYSYNEADFRLEEQRKPCYAKYIIVATVFIFLCIIISWNISYYSLAENIDNHYPNGDAIVRITRTGTKYHFSSCSYLHSSSIKITLEDAFRKGYSSCSRCDPPEYISMEDYLQAKDEQRYVLNIILALVISVPISFISYFVMFLITIPISRVLSWFDDYTPGWIFVVSAVVIYITAFIQGIRAMIIW